MRDLLEFIIEGILKNKEFTIEEETVEDKITYKIKVAEDRAGLIIGKSGRTIKAIRNLLKVRATLEKKLVYLTIEN